ncbi:MAG: RnfABCDGE type electron transport complex subunit D [Spirochaetaceae bacterium]|jgi:electron transport complex protein RnfD|nr:RnfABCDGE type electron transport complex subunit D [Spirochaetaceae bacterium]
MSSMDTKIIVTGSPQIHSRQSTKKIMWLVSAALAPSAIWGVYLFGLPALWVMMLSIGSAVIIEGLLNKNHAFETLKDGSAFLTGLLIGMNLPPALGSIHYFYIPIAASFFAIFVVKWTFGGLGTNWMNPALAGRVFVFFSWTGAMNHWTLPSRAGLDAISGPTPLGSLKTGLMSIGDNITGPISLLASEGVPVSYKELFLGQIPGCIGEVSALLLLLGAIFLLIKKIITLDIPLSYLLSFSLLIWIFGGKPFGTALFTGDVLFHLLSGGLILGVFFMATDLVTTPLTTKGRIIFGIGCGVLTFLIRFYGSFPEGVSLSIIFMNIFVPLIDYLIKPKRFGIKNNLGGKANA